MQCVLLWTGFQVNGLLLPSATCSSIPVIPIWLDLLWNISNDLIGFCLIVSVSSYDVHVCVGDPRRPYPTDLEMRSGMLGNISNMSTNGVNGHLPGDALAAGRLPGRFTLLFRCLICPCSLLFLVVFIISPFRTEITDNLLRDLLILVNSHCQWFSGTCACVYTHPIKTW